MELERKGRIVYCWATGSIYEGSIFRKLLVFGLNIEKMVILSLYVLNEMNIILC